ncbi:hypothetical protein Cgig2_016338 [Carnegiea gigantea]|uniref:Uncharacterized protein n=1 Tax=Carnegiea gigantea TaxID=171969 RepID=A0A9Q1Q875_9CARY|nr:hypothetical protein Cgig2_016338 [Carnegiea gigantea]
MFRLLLGTPLARPLLSTSSLFFPSNTFRLKSNERSYKCLQMGIGDTNSESIRKVSFRLCNVSGYMTELLEIQAPNPTLHVLFIPAIGHISHSSKDWEHGRLFSLQEQIEHKIDFIAHELENNNTPVILVGHSIGSHISIEIFKRISHKESHSSLLTSLPPIAVIVDSSGFYLSVIRGLSGFLSSLVSSIVAMLGLIPRWSKFIVKKTLGNSWSPTAVEAACSHLIKYHMMRNMLFMARTEFQMFSDAPDWEFLRAKQDQLAFLFGIDDHWCPLSLFEEVSKEVPDLHLSIEKGGHGHAFSCTEGGSIWVARHVASLIATIF